MTFDDNYSVNLKMGEWLTLICSVYDGIHESRKRGHRHTADGYHNVLDIIRSQVDEHLEACQRSREEEQNKLIVTEKMLVESKLVIDEKLPF